MNKEHYLKLERMYLSAPINEFYKPAIKISEGRAEITVQVRSEFFHAANAVHGSAYFKSLDDAAFFAVNSLVEDVFVLTINFNLHLLRPISSSEMKAIGKVVHSGRRLFLAESVLLNSEGKEIARGSGTFMKSKVPLAAEIGYL
jgi:uncharacterized protein (TIGR00369 family)